MYNTFLSCGVILKIDTADERDGRTFCLNCHVSYIIYKSIFLVISILIFNYAVIVKFYIYASLSFF